MQIAKIVHKRKHFTENFELLTGLLKTLPFYEERLLNRLNRKEGGRNSDGSTLHCCATIYDGLAGTYLGQRLLSVVRGRE